MNREKIMFAVLAPAICGLFAMPFMPNESVKDVLRQTMLQGLICGSLASAAVTGIVSLSETDWWKKL